VADALVLLHLWRRDDMLSLLQRVSRLRRRGAVRRDAVFAVRIGAVISLCRLVIHGN